MTLQLVTGPTNARKAGVVLGLVRRWATAGHRPVLVVPTGPDADQYRRELVGLAGGMVADVAVTTADGLAALARRAAGVPPADLGALARDRLLVAGLAALPAGRPLAHVGARPRVRRRLDLLLEELAERGLGVEDLHEALERLDPEEQDVDPELLADLRTLVGAAAAAVEAHPALHGRRSPATVAVEVRRALAAEPHWRRPVALYGFDDLTFGQLALVRALARSADVVVSLPFEDGRRATAARRAVVNELRRSAEQLPLDGPGGTGLLPLRGGAPVLAGSTVARLDPREVVLADAPAEGGRGLLARRLFEERAAAPAATEGGDVLADVVEVVGGDARAEAEALVLELRDAVREHELPWHEVAVAVRDAEGLAGARIERALTIAGIPVARPRSEPARRSAVGRALLALGRLLLGRGDVDDAIRWIRAATPAAPSALDAVDRWAIALRRDGVERAAVALDRAAAVPELAAALAPVAAPGDGAEPTVGEGSAVPRDGVRDEPGAPAGPRSSALGAVPDVAALAAALRGALPVAAAGAGDDGVRGVEVLERWLAEVEALAATAPGLLGGPEELLEELALLPLPAGREPAPGRVEIADPQALRGRHLAVLAIADLREAAFPAPEPVDPLVDRDARAVLRAAGGAALLDVPVERVAAERMLFLELVARPRQRLVLSRPEATERGDAVPEAPFLADLRAALAPHRPRVVRRPASAVDAPARRALAAPAPLGAALDAVGRETVRRVLLERSRFTVREVERLARCPVCWLVEHLAGARDDRPESEPQRHGTLVHDVLQRAVGEAARDRPYGELDPERLVAAGEAALDELAPQHLAGLPPHRADVVLRRARSGVAAVLAGLVERYDGARLDAVEVEVGEDGAVPPLDLGGGAVAVGRVDRVDRVALPDGGEGVGVVDYKLGGSGAVPATRWQDTATLQAALYLAAVAAADEADPAYALYQPTAPRTGVLTGARPAAGLELRRALAGGSNRGPADLDAVREALDDALDQARDAVAALRAGGIAPTAEQSVHGREGGCDHPAIARLL